MTIDNERACAPRHCEGGTTEAIRKKNERRRGRIFSTLTEKQNGAGVQDF
jgi:hypothetical protein